jgi:hypothetical protein
MGTTEFVDNKYLLLENIYIVDSTFRYLNILIVIIVHHLTAHPVLGIG